MKHILCFGDSNLFGTNPSGGRWPLDQRWTGLLSSALGPEYRIIEEGLGGRTTVFDDPLEENRCGLRHLPIMLHSHRPLDLVILSLGTNDCKLMFNTNAKIIAKAVEKLALIVKEYPYGEHYPIPQVLVISPIHSGRGVENSSFFGFDYQSHLLSKQLGPAIREMALKNKFLFLDASLVAQSSPIDQLHMDAEGHAALAKAILPLVLDWFGDDRAIDVRDQEHLENVYDQVRYSEGIGKDEEIQSGQSEQEDSGMQGPSNASETQGVNKETATSSRRGRLPLSFGFFRKRS
ncbi:MAG: G-D-S-L family lipolytic protein [Spirochaetia bacterium]|nr:G-D-S-L family lipolytic protein [Spirochaetia bacterium]